jgi:hypothetical protein
VFWIVCWIKALFLNHGRVYLCRNPDSADSRVPSGSRISVESSAVYVGYGTRGSWREDLELKDLFPFWRPELWSK